MYFLQGLLVGLATFAPVGMQNLFIINTALVQPVRRIILTLAILALFDMSLSAAAFLRDRCRIRNVANHEAHCYPIWQLAHHIYGFQYI